MELRAGPDSMGGWWRSQFDVGRCVFGPGSTNYMTSDKLFNLWDSVFESEDMAHKNAQIIVMIPYVIFSALLLLSTDEDSEKCPLS